MGKLLNHNLDILKPPVDELLKPFNKPNLTQEEKKARAKAEADKKYIEDFVEKYFIPTWMKNKALSQGWNQWLNFRYRTSNHAEGFHNSLHYSFEGE
jgi:hypothetical protein